jgi:acyl-CoA thioesterase-1
MPAPPARLLSVLLGLLVSLPACGPDDPEPVPSSRLFDRAAPEAGAPRPTLAEIPEDAPLVMFLGDSFSSGLHLASNQAFPALLQQRLAAEGLPFRLVNAGVSGDTSAGGLRRLDWLLQQQPAILVLELGGNDGLRGQTIHGTEGSPGVYDNMRQIVERSLAVDVRVLLLGARMPPSHGAQYTTAFAQLYHRIADELDVPLVADFLDEVGGNDRYLLSDGLHPNPEGHERLADTVIDELRALLELQDA